MQDMIRRIVEADNEAKAMEEANLKEAEENRKKIELEAEARYEQAMKEARETADKNDRHEEAVTNKQLEEIESKQRSSLIKLKADYGNNRDRWVDEIVSRVINE